MASELTIDGNTYTFEDGETILDVARRNGIFIPTLCHLSGTTPTGACRICVVEMEKERKLVASCTTPAAPGMVIRTESERVVRSRRLTLELLLSMGNHNCAIRTVDPETWTELQLDAADYDEAQDLCPVYGECRLQEYAYRYQVRSDRFRRITPHYGFESKNPLLVRDFSRCILCGRCVQACNEVQVNNAISSGYRGHESKIVALGDRPLAESDCVFCGECAQVCPVGALVEKKSRFKARLWNVKRVRTTCHFCGLGCQMVLHVADGKIVKVRGADDTEPNRGSLCMRGRFAYDFVHSQNRLTKPLLRQDGELKEASWEDAVARVAEKIREVKEQHGPDAIACIVSPKLTNEEIYLLQKLFRDVVGTNNVAQSEHVAAAGVFMHNTLDEIEAAPVAIVVGANVTEDSPVAAAALKRSALKGNKLIVIDSRSTRIAQHATLHLSHKDGMADVVVSSLAKAISGEGDGKLAPQNAARETGVPTERVAQAAEIVKTAEGVVLLYDHTAIACPEHLDHLRRLAGENINAVTGNNNTQGACLMGALPGFRPGLEGVEGAPGLTIREIEKKAKDGSLKLLFCAGENVATAGAAANDNLFTVALATHKNHGTQEADVVLPMAAWSECEGTTMNSEQRLSLVRKAVEPVGEAKPGLWIASAIAGKLGQDWGDRSAQEVWEGEIVPSVAGLADASYEAIGKGLRRRPSSLPDLVVPGWKSAEYHHKVLLEESEQVSELSEPKGRDRIGREFCEFLQAEGCPDSKQAIDETIGKYRRKRGSIVPALQRVQEVLGFLPPVVQRYIALGLGLPPSDVYGIVTFYSFFTQIPRGKFVIKVCMGTACFVMGAVEITHKLEETLGVEVGNTTEDRLFTLETVRCLGACGLAPVVMVNEETHGHVSPTGAVKILEECRATVHAS